MATQWDIGSSYSDYNFRVILSYIGYNPETNKSEFSIGNISGYIDPAHIESGGSVSNIYATFKYNGTTEEQIYIGLTCSSDGIITSSYISKSRIFLSNNADASARPYTVTLSKSRWASTTTNLNNYPNGSLAARFTVSDSQRYFGQSTTVDLKVYGGYYAKLSASVGSVTKQYSTVYNQNSNISLLIHPDFLGGIASGQDRGTMVITATTYTDAECTTVLGTQTASITVLVDVNETAPSYTLTVTPVNENPTISAAGICVQGMTKARVQITNIDPGLSGLTIASIAVIGGGYIGNTADFTTDYIVLSGTVTFSVRVANSAGYATAKSYSLYFHPYTAPYLSADSCYRSDSSGTSSAIGNYFRAIGTIEKSDIQGIVNTASATICYKSVSGSFSSPDTFLSGTQYIGGDGNLQVYQSYVIRITVTDTLGGSSVKDYLVAQQSTTIFVKQGGKGIGFGESPTNDNEVTTPWKIKAGGGFEGSILSSSIASGTDLDSIVSPRFYGGSSSSVYLHCPVSAVAFTLAVYDGLQVLTAHDASCTTYRRSYDGSSWNQWVQ